MKNICKNCNGYPYCLNSGVCEKQLNRYVQNFRQARTNVNPPSQYQIEIVNNFLSAHPGHILPRTYTYEDYYMFVGTYVFPWMKRNKKYQSFEYNYEEDGYVDWDWL